MDKKRLHVAVVGGGPAGLMAAETIRQNGIDVSVYDRMGSVGRKFLLAGKGGLNLTHAEPPERFAQRYGERSARVAAWLERFDAQAMRRWAADLGIETFVGSSGRVFPADLKAAPLLRRWVRRLHDQGVVFCMHQRWLGWHADGSLRFVEETGETHVQADALVLALGGGSWPQLGSDGNWTDVLAQAGIELAPLLPSNMGFELDWSEHLVTHFAGAPLKAVVAHWRDRDGVAHARQGECVVSEYGLEGSLIYAISADLREQLLRSGHAELVLDLAPHRDEATLAKALAKPRGKHSIGQWLRRQAGLDAVKCALVFELAGAAIRQQPRRLAAIIKQLPLTLKATRPLAEAISSAGGVQLEALNEDLMVHQRPGLFCAGEMLDWEAPTGGYLLTASFASGRVAGQGVLRWLERCRARRDAGSCEALSAR